MTFQVGYCSWRVAILCQIQIILWSTWVTLAERDSVFKIAVDRARELPRLARQCSIGGYDLALRMCTELVFFPGSDDG